ncbi:S1 family peptidase [Brevundimonas lenta]|uniref:S1-C subfamily serine protease n=1 Tax=Brevundimonas lenta TaxID=424796 RepID=A0A7W6NQQ4_9CAUL|nr:serine protease [Brevundimonas lenta]MBB4083390.1 S1-C subfamily serine protease [Brevundimonas lenta]
MFDLQTPPSNVSAPPVAEVVQARPAWDLTVGLINATVQIDQPVNGATRRVGTAFLVDAPRPDGRPRTVMVTAAHVLDGMPAPEARIGWRTQITGGGWRFAPEPLRIRTDDGDPLWTKHPERDVAVMEVFAPAAFASAAIPLGWLAEPQALDVWQVGPGDELLTLGYPHGYAANTAGFPILRAGRVASWPLTPISAFPTFLLDFAVFPGNSGGPVFWTPAARKLPGTAQPDHPFIAGVLVQEMRVNDQSVGIGVVAHAEYIREAIALLDAPSP